MDEAKRGDGGGIKSADIYWSLMTDLGLSDIFVHRLLKKIEPLRGFKSLPVWLSPEQAMKIIECLTIARARAQSLILDKPDGLTVATTVVVHAHSAGIEVEAPRAA